MAETSAVVRPRRSLGSAAALVIGRGRDHRAALIRLDARRHGRPPGPGLITVQLDDGGSWSHHVGPVGARGRGTA